MSMALLSMGMGILGMTQGGSAKNNAKEEYKISKKAYKKQMDINNAVASMNKANVKYAVEVNKAKNLDYFKNVMEENYKRSANNIVSLASTGASLNSGSEVSQRVMSQSYQQNSVDVSNYAEQNKQTKLKGFYSELGIDYDNAVKNISVQSEIALSASRQQAKVMEANGQIIGGAIQSISGAFDFFGEMKKEKATKTTGTYTGEDTYNLGFGTKSDGYLNGTDFTNPINSNALSFGSAIK